MVIPDEPLSNKAVPFINLLEIEILITYPRLTEYFLFFRKWKSLLESRRERNFPFGEQFRIGLSSGGNFAWGLSHLCFKTCCVFEERSCLWMKITVKWMNPLLWLSDFLPLILHTREMPDLVFNYATEYAIQLFTSALLVTSSRMFVQTSKKEKVHVPKSLTKPVIFLVACVSLLLSSHDN